MIYRTFARFRASSFSIFCRSMMQSEKLSLAGAACDDHFGEVFEEYGVDFGGDDDVVYTPAISLWALVSQVFFSGEQS